MKQTSRKPHYRSGVGTICALHKGSSWMNWVHSAQVAESLHVSKPVVGRRKGERATGRPPTILTAFG